MRRLVCSTSCYRRPIGIAVRRPRRFQRDWSKVARGILLVIFGISVGCTFGARPALGVPGEEIVPQPVYRVLLGPIEQQEFQKRLEEVQYVYNQLVAIKNMVETKDWTGVGNMLGDFALSGLNDPRLKAALSASKNMADEMLALNPETFVKPGNYSTTADYRQALSRALDRRATSLLKTAALINERYGTFSISSNGTIVETSKANTLSFFIQYQREALQGISKTFHGMQSDQGSLTKATYLNTQLLINQNLMFLELLQAVGDQNRLLAMQLADGVGGGQ